MAKSVVYSILTLCISFYVVHCGGDVNNAVCQTESPCSCQFDDHYEVGLKGLFPTAAKDKFLGDAHGNYSYFFSGCEDQEFNAFQHGLNSTQVLHGSLIKCFTNISVVLENVTNIINNQTEIIQVNVTVIIANCSILGTAKQIKYNKAEDDVLAFQIVYNDGGKNNIKSLPSVRLVCDSYQYSVLKTVNINSDVLALYSPTVCTRNIGGGGEGLSGGSVFLILLFVGVSIYLIGGGFIMYSIRGARGVEVIPNLDFWRSIPGLVRDGAIYIFSGCRPVSIVSSADTYDSI